jgi:Cell division protein CrgA
MPKSKSRKKPSKQRYGLYPQRKQKTKASPKWFAPVMLAIMGLGVAIIVWNFFRGSGDAYDPRVMWVGLGLIAGGFFGISFWR